MDLSGCSETAGLKWSVEKGFPGPIPGTRCVATAHVRQCQRERSAYFIRLKDFHYLFDGRRHRGIGSSNYLSPWASQVFRSFFTQKAANNERYEHPSEV